MKYIEDEFRMASEMEKSYEALAKLAKLPRKDSTIPSKTLELNVGNIENVTFTLPMFDHEQIKDVIFHNPATIVFWKDGTKTVVKCQTDKGDTYNPELGLAMCIIKKMCGNKGNYNNVFNKWLPKENNEDSIKPGKKTCDICTSIDREEHCMWEKNSI